MDIGPFITSKTPFKKNNGLIIRHAENQYNISTINKFNSMIKIGGQNGHDEIDQDQKMKEH